MNNRRFRLPQFVIVSMVALATLLFSRHVYSQGARAAGGELQLKNIRKLQMNAPTYGVGSGELGGGRPSTLARQWLMIETQFASDPPWADDVKIKYYVLMGKGKEQKMFSGEVTHVNVQKGTQHYSVMYIHPNTLKRYGAGDVEAIAAQLYYQNRLMSQISAPPTNKRWWEEYTPTPGFLLNPLETPWSVVAPERFEALKSVATP